MISPNQVKNLRGRYGSAGNKDDRFDAFVCRHAAHSAGPAAPLTQEAGTGALRRACRARKDLLSHRVAVANQLRAHLHNVFPGAAGLFAELDSPVSLAFLARFDTQDRADWLTLARLGRWLAGIGYPGHTDPAVLHARLFAAPRGITGPAAAAQAPITRALHAVLVTLTTQIKALSARSATSSPRTPTATSSSRCPAQARARCPAARRDRRLPRSVPHPRITSCLASAAPPPPVGKIRASPSDGL